MIPASKPGAGVGTPHDGESVESIISWMAASALREREIWVGPGDIHTSQPLLSLTEGRNQIAYFCGDAQLRFEASACRFLTRNTKNAQVIIPGLYRFRQ
jgi:hypothetical protein